MKHSLKISLFTLLFSVICSFEAIAQDAIVTINQDEAITRLLALKKSVNKKKENYTIRAFRGQRGEAEAALSAYKKAFSKWDFELKQASPAYEISLGNYRTRLEAERVLIELKSKCTTAFKNKANLMNKCLQSFPVKPKTKS